MSLRSWFAEQLAEQSPARPVVLAVVFCLLAAALLTDFRTDVGQGLTEGAVASEDVRAPIPFPFVDEAATTERREAAERAVRPVYEADPALGMRVEGRVKQAFDMARRRVEAGQEGSRPGSRIPLPAATRSEIQRDVSTSLDVVVEPSALGKLTEDGFSEASEALVLELVGVGFRRWIVRDATERPAPGESFSVIVSEDGKREESLLSDASAIRTPEEARQAVSLYVLERYASADDPALVQASAALARALIRPNFSANEYITSERRAKAGEGIDPVRVEVRRGARIVREGDVIDRRQAAMLDSLNAADQSVGSSWRYAIWLAFTAVVTLAPVAFARSTMRKFTRKQVELETIGGVLLLVLGLGRLALSLSGTVRLPGQADASTLGLLLPVAGGAMLVRILVNSESALVFSLVASLLAGALMDQSALLTAWYLVTALVAASAVGQARERLNVLRAGVLAGVVGAGLVLIIALLKAQGDPTTLTGLNVREAAGQALTALASGVLSAMLCLGLVPFMEVFGFLTDYKLHELANLNHPLLRRLMLQAPGTYHHSVIVGSLSEAACEAIGANALLARVACYFHDIGKGVKPQYFVENQRDGQNRHDRLNPEQSAQIIINHVREGGALARQHKLPAQIYDNIFMHHGTGLIQYFYNRAKEQAGGEPVDDALFRYPGPKPNTREAGIIMLADKVEAACRTIREPSEERMRAMIQAIINQVMADGQLVDCPITVRELYQIADAFVAVLNGIYHHRIEYPATRAISQGAGKLAPVPKQATITLEILEGARPPPLGRPPAGADYEAVDPDLPPRSTDLDDA